MAETPAAKKTETKPPVKKAAPKKEPAAKAEPAPKKQAPVKEPAAKKPAPKKTSEVKPAPKTVLAAKAPEEPEEVPAVKKNAPAPKAHAKTLKTAEVNVYSLDGKIEKSISLPGIFNTQFRPDIIRKAVNSSRANRRQAYGPAARAGMRHTVSWPGKGRGMARTPRLLHGGGKGAQAPNTPGGRRAHPPRPEKDWTEKINKKERTLALRSAIAAVGNHSIVTARGHRIPDGITVPLVVNDDFELLFDKITKEYKKENKRPAYTKETIRVLEALGLSNEMTRAKDGIHLRAGRGKTRGRRFKKPSSILFVVNDTEKARKCLGNLPGVEVVAPSKLNLEHLAPGGDPGRLTVFTEKALMTLEGEK